MALHDNANNALALVRHTFALTRNKPVLLAIPAIYFLLNLLYILAFLAGLGMATAFPPLLVLYVIVFYFVGWVWVGVNNLLAAAQSHMVYLTAKSEPVTPGKGIQRAWENLDEVIQLTASDRFAMQIAHGGDETDAADWSLRKIFEEGYDVMRNYILPDIINSGRSFPHSVTTLSKLKHRILESAAGAVLFNTLSNTLISALISFILRAIGWIALIPAVITFALLPFIVLYNQLSLIIVLLLTVALTVLNGLILVLVLVGLFCMATTLIGTAAMHTKTTYFTLMWMQLNEPTSIAANPEMKTFLEKENRLLRAAAQHKPSTHRKG